MQLRLVYSLLKPAIRAAAKFNIQIGTLDELVRLCLFETHSKTGASTSQIAERFGQTARSMRSLQQRLLSDFFTAERKPGLVRDVEERIAQKPISRGALAGLFSGSERNELAAALDVLLDAQRIVEEAGKLRVAPRYAIMSSDRFHHRIDALNHFLDGVYRATLQRLVYDNAHTAAIKTITFSAKVSELEAFRKKLEANLRLNISELEESATFDGCDGQRFTLALLVTPIDEHDTEAPDDAG